jgi:hypothetical protein
MPDLKLPRLPDRTPIKLAITVSPDLHNVLSDYTAIYNKTYGQSEPMSELIPHMLASFLAGDRAFQKERGGLGDG